MNCLTKEQCQVKLFEIEGRIAELKEEYKANKLLITNKVKGQIRSAQRRNKEIKEKIEGLRLHKECYYNGGVF